MPVAVSRDAAHGGGKPISTSEGGTSPRIRYLGTTQYELAWRAMQAFTAARSPETSDEIWITEHEPVYTLGLAGKREHLLRKNAIPVVKVDRGGQITFHGPGQTVAYPLVDIARLAMNVRTLVERTQSAVLGLLAHYGVEGFGRREAPGVYVNASGQVAKVAALGFKIRRGCSYHGVSLNRDMDLAPFADINPCGYPGLQVTDLRRLGVIASADEIERRLGMALCDAFQSGVDLDNRGEE